MHHFETQDGIRTVNWRDRAQKLRSLPLPSVLGLLGAQPDRHDPAKWHTEQGILTVTGAKFINWNRGSGGGGAIDLVMHLQKVGFGQALEWLEGHFPGTTPPQLQPPPTQHALRLPTPQAGNWERVQRYLLRERKLPAALLQPLIQSGAIYADDRANAVFLLHGANAEPVGAELRGSTASSWRGMAPGSQKDLGFFSIPSTPLEAIVLCESAIDAISCHALHPRYRCLSTAGARPAPGWLRNLIQQGHPIYCGFDFDPTGESMAARMLALHPSLQRLRPSRKDWNDVLRLPA